MATFFLICAVVGGTILACQILMMLFGLGGHIIDMDVPHDFHGDMGSADFHGDAGGTDFHGGADGHAADGHSADAEHHSGASAKLFGVLSFRTVVAGLTFFGLGGLAAHYAGAGYLISLLVAAGAGVAAMYSVFWVMRTIMLLQSEGTARVERSMGAPGTVYLRIPGHQGGQGKVHLTLQSRTMEYQAVTSGEPLPAGAKVVVVDVLGPDTVEVAPVLEPERSEREDV